MTHQALELALGFLVVASATCCIASHYLAMQRLFWLTKPLTMLFVIAIAAWPSANSSTAYQQLLVIGLLFSLAGDVFLMLPSDRFIAGLGSFFIGHLCYVGAFATDVGLTTALARDPLVFLILLIPGASVYAYLWPHLGGMKAPVAVYVLAIAAMAWQATARWLDAGPVGELGALLACTGAGLFVVSDSVLAINRFRRPFAAAQAVVLGTYFLAQLLIALSVGAGEALVDGGPR